MCWQAPAMGRWWVCPLVLCILLLQPGHAKRGKKSSKKKYQHGRPGTAASAAPDQADKARQAVQQGMQLVAAGEIADAEKIFSHVLKVDPTNYAALGNRALLLPRLNRAAEGVAALEHAGKVYPTDPSVWYNLGTLQVNLGGRDADAVASFGRAVEVAPKGNDVATHATNSLGAVLFQIGRMGEALEAFDTALAAGGAVDPASRQQTTLNRAAALTKLNRAGEAIPIYDQALKDAPDDLPTRMSRAAAWREVASAGEKPAAAELKAAEDFVTVLETMTERGIEEVQVEPGENGAKVGFSFTNFISHLK